GRVEQTVELGFAEVGLFQRQFLDRPAFLVCLFGDGGALVVTDHGVERGDENRVFRQGFVDVGFVDGEAGDGLVGQDFADVGDQFDALQQVVGNNRQHDVE